MYGVKKSGGQSDVINQSDFTKMFGGNNNELALIKTLMNAGSGQPAQRASSQMKNQKFMDKTGTRYNKKPPIRNHPGLSNGFKKNTENTSTP